MSTISRTRSGSTRRLFACLCAALLLLTVSATPASAETEKMRIFSYVTKIHAIPIGFARAPANVIFERAGLASYEDGTVGVWQGRGAIKATPKGGTAEGFSQMTFEDKSTYVTKWEVSFTKDEKTELNSYKGKGTYVSGTGRFEGIQGEITIAGRQLTPMAESTKSDSYYDVTGTYTVPAK